MERFPGDFARFQTSETLILIIGSIYFCIVILEKKNAMQEKCPDIHKKGMSPT